jgi:hypothetical protein
MLNIRVLISVAADPNSRTDAVLTRASRVKYSPDIVYRSHKRTDVFRSRLAGFDILAVGALSSFSLFFSLSFCLLFFFPFFFLNRDTVRMLQQRYACVIDEVMSASAGTFAD